MKTLPLNHNVLRFVTGCFMLCIFVFTPQYLHSEAASDLLGRLSCAKLKKKLQEQPQEVFKMWVKSGKFGSNSAVANEIIMRGDLYAILGKIGDLETMIQALDEMANGTAENVAKIFTKWMVGKVFDGIKNSLGTGVPGAVYTVCDELYQFADALSAESLDINIRAFAKMAEKNPDMLDHGYFMETYLGWDGKNITKFNTFSESREYGARRNAVVEYAQRKLNMKRFPSSAEWGDNRNLVRNVTNLMVKDARAIYQKKKKIEQLQGQLKAQVAALKREQAVLNLFQSMRNQVKAMTCQDTASKDCLSVYNTILSGIQDLGIDAGDVEATTPGMLDDIKARLNSLYQLLEGYDKRVDNNYKSRVEEYCKNADNKLKPLEKTISIARKTNSKIAAKAVVAKGFRNQACSEKDDPDKAKKAADSAKSAASEAYLLFNAIPLLPSDLDKYIAPKAIDFSGAQSELAGIKGDIETIGKSVTENYKKWEAVRSAAANVRKNMKPFNDHCGKDSLIDGIAASVMASRFEGEIKQVESKLPDIRYENNMLGGFSRKMADIRSFLTRLKARHDTYRQCLATVPDIEPLVIQAKALVAEGSRHVALAEQYAKEAKDCADKVKPRCTEDADCPAGFVCKDGNCVEETQPQCTSDSDCPAGFICEDGNCVEAPQPQCTEDSDCPAGEVCQDGNCVAAPQPQCTSDSDCPAGFICVDGSCVEPQQPQCSSDSDCPAGEVCQDGNCVEAPKPQCMSDADCPRDHVCRNGKCVYQEPTGCRSRDDCPTGYVCNRKTGDCVSPFDQNHSSFTSAQTSREDQRSQNQADQVANDQNTASNDNSGDNMNQALTDVHGQVSQECYKNSDCTKPGYYCHDGKCVKKPSCSSDSDCSSGYVCQSGNCVREQQTAQTPTPTQPATPAAPDTLAISPANKVITKSETVSLKAVLTKGDGSTQDITGQASWSPSANFSSTKIGSHTVTASYQKLSANATVTVVEEKGLGDITVSKKTVTVTFWDHGTEDGDMIDININGKAVFSGITLTKAPQSRTITLTAGALVFGFTALNEGRISPNTATVKFSSVTSGKAEQKYTLKKNSKANMNITYNPK